MLLSREPARPTLPPAKPPPVRTRVVELRARDYQVTVRAQGVVRARDEITLSAQVAGRVARVADDFEDGAFFSEGALLLELEADDSRIAVAMAEARVQSTEAAARLAELAANRDATMLRNLLLPAAQAEVSAATLTQARAEAATAAAQLERARHDLERTRVRAPFAGAVRRRMVGTGQWVSPGTALGSLFAVDAVEVRLPVSAAALAFLDLPGERIGLSGTETKPAQEVVLQDSLATLPGLRWLGRVVRGEQALDADTLERFVIVRVDDPFGLDSGRSSLRPGQPVIGILPGRVLTNVFALPRAAVRELDRVNLVDPDRLTLSTRRITPLWSDAEHIVVRDPAIQDGTLLATTHLVYAPEGAKVEIIPDIPVAATNTPAVTNQPAAKP